MVPRLLEFLDRNERQMFALLREMVLIQSGSFNKRGIDALVEVVEHSLGSSCLGLNRVRRQEFGDHLVAFSPAVEKAEKAILLMGHTDTVFPEDTSFDTYREDEQHAFGPGVIDMKGGLVAGIFALKAFQETGLLENLPVRFLFNSDEEIGSHSSDPLIIDLAGKSACAFVLECGGMDGGVVTGRKGRLGIRVHTEGGEGHAAFAGVEKPSAILELAHKVIALEGLNDFSEGMTLNVGKIEGGIGPNTVARNACALVDIRYVSAPSRSFTLGKIREIVEREIVTGVKARFDIESERVPMPQDEKNRTLFRIAEDAARHLGIPIREEFRSGVSDANLIASLGIPVLDGLGPIGSLDHSEKEFMIKTSLVERTKLLSLILLQTGMSLNPVLFKTHSAPLQ
jgi:glutamate carboxypeptidase